MNGVLACKNSKKDKKMINIEHPEIERIEPDTELGLKSNHTERRKQAAKERRIYSANEGIEIGLTTEQVKTPNFCFHTIEAIKTIQQRNPGLSVHKAFEIVQGKSPEDTSITIKKYLLDTRKKQVPLNEMSLIRVLVNSSNGFGYQRASIILMQKLRELGFKGTFDIQCDDHLGARLINDQTREFYKNIKPVVSSNLISMITDLNPLNTNEDGIIQVASLGAVKISSLPYNYKHLNLPKADLAVCAGDKYSTLGEKRQNKTLCASSYINLQPTDSIFGNCFVIYSDNIAMDLPSALEMRLSSNAESQFCYNLSSVTLSAIEEKVLTIVEESSINTQLICSLYLSYGAYYKNNNGNGYGYLDLVTGMSIIIRANAQLSRRTDKPTVMLLPQQIALDVCFMEKLRQSNEFHLLDLTKDTKEVFESENYKKGDVIIVHTGVLQQPVFDYLMLKGTTLPPVIEGCNSREICESAGKPFIFHSFRKEQLKKYDVKPTNKQELHAQASICLSQCKQEKLIYLMQYMEEALTSDRDLYAYHEQRKIAFLSRPDACEMALDTLGIDYEKNLEQELQPQPIKSTRLKIGL